jgi:uncharacterized protein YecE (DUF72 family)
VDKTLQKLASKQIFIGTSSWKYPGWKDWFYRKTYKSVKAFNETCLEEYATLFSAVGVDHTYYAWPTEKLFLKYAEQTPAHFRFSLKATERCTVFQFPKFPRYGKDAGKKNSDFLNPDLFKERFLRPLDAVAEKLGPILLEFSQFYPGMIDSGREFTRQLDAFLSELKTETAFSFAVEIRNRGWLQPEYLKMLSSHRVSHVHNSWTRMPPLAEQLEATTAFDFPSIVSRVLLQPGTKYEEAVEAFSPYDKVQEEQPELRQATAKLILRALELKVPAYVFVNNRAEGSAPKTIEGVVEILKAETPFKKLMA